MFCNACPLSQWSKSTFNVDTIYVLRTCICLSWHGNTLYIYMYVPYLQSVSSHEFTTTTYLYWTKTLVRNQCIRLHIHERLHRVHDTCMSELCIRQDRGSHLHWRLSHKRVSSRRSNVFSYKSMPHMTQIIIWIYLLWNVYD